MGGKQSSESKSDQGEGPTLSETRYRPDDSPVVIPDSLQPSFSTTMPPPPPHHRPLPPPQPSPPHRMHRPSPSPPLSQRYRPSASNNDLPRTRFGSTGPHHHHHQRQPAAPDLLDWDFLLSDFPRPPRPSPPPSHRTHRSSSASSSIDRERRRRRAELREQLGAASTTAGVRMDPFTLLLRGLRRSDAECPVCHEEVPSGDFQRHMSECARRPKLQYNEDVLRISSGECSICLEDMSPGDTIARLPCLCVYHVKCIDEWFRVKQTCPEHPDLSQDCT